MNGFVPLQLIQSHLRVNAQLRGIRMNRQFLSVRVACVIRIAAIFAALTGTAAAQIATKEFVSRDANVDGASIHYTTGG